MFDLTYIIECIEKEIIVTFYLKKFLKKRFNNMITKCFITEIY